MKKLGSKYIFTKLAFYRFLKKLQNSRCKAKNLYYISGILFLKFGIKTLLFYLQEKLQKTEKYEKQLPQDSHILPVSVC